VSSLLRLPDFSAVIRWPLGVWTGTGARDSGKEQREVHKVTSRPDGFGIGADTSRVDRQSISVAEYGWVTNPVKARMDPARRTLDKESPQLQLWFTHSGHSLIDDLHHVPKPFPVASKLG
jgi:cytolysin (calcineurin-like family phosphatase)